MTPEFEKFWTMTKHGEGVYGPPPLRGCKCVICLHTRSVRVYCPACDNAGASPYCGPFGCWTCGRGTYWTEPVMTDDVALGA